MILKPTLLMITLFMVIGSVSAKNIFPNPGFENKISLGLWPASTSATVKPDKKVFRSGKSSVRIDLLKTADRAVVYTGLSLLPEKSYSLSFWYKIENWQKSGNASVKIKLLFNKTNGANGSAGTLRITLPFSNTSGWKNFSTEFKTPSGTDKCQLSILEATGVKGTLWVDDVNLEQIVDSLKINKTSIAPRIDGKLNDYCWKKAIPLACFYRPDYRTEYAKMQTKAYICYDKNNIYIAFRNIEPEISKLKTDASRHDDAVWNDDCNEVFLLAPNSNIRQFIVNAANVKGDCELYIRAPGDPYRAKVEWNGKWQSATRKGKNEWVSEIAIPFSNFNYTPNGVWRINLSRQRHGAASECSHWNRVEGKLNNANKFGFLEFGPNSAKLARFIESGVENPLQVKRKATKFKELLSEKKGDYIVGSWAHGFHISSYSKAFQAKYTPATSKLEQEQFLAETGRAGMFGPAFPWVPNYIGGMSKIRELNEKYGMKFPYSVQNSSLHKKAVAKGVNYVYLTAKGVAMPNPVDPVLAQVINENLENYLKKHSDVIPYLVLVNGEDEPTNTNSKSFSFKENLKNKSSLEKLDAKIKKDFGFGKFGIYDYYADADSKWQSPFNHIAFWSWWSDEYSKIRKKDQAVVKRLAPNVPYLINFNSCSCFNYPDFTRISTAVDWVSCDPYPTATLALHGRDRALYHTGFSTKLIHDSAAPGVKTCVMPQAYIYHGRGPSPEDIREWASQAMKNGASILYWYTLGPSRITIPAGHKEMLRVNKLISSMNELKLPQKTVTALFFSQAARRGIKDEAQYSLYTLYVLLGEKLKTWFKFVNETMLDMDMDSLDSYRLVYVPELKYVDTETAGRLLKFVENGGILVLFDPEAFEWNINGTVMNDFRDKLVGAPVGKRRKANELIVAKNYLGLTKGAKLPLSEIRGRAGAGKELAYDVQVPSDANVFAVYSDGKPAAYERSVGKGKVIYFAAQPFGNAKLAISKSSWETFLSGLAKKVGEPENLPIWDFLFPLKGGEVEVNYIIKPER